jgi:DNA-formamidopyrimidine glycosylase
VPELPEVESVRAGLARYLIGRTIEAVEVLDPRPLRRQVGGPEAFVHALIGRTVRAAVRRGKLLWLPLDDDRALSAHLGMSGQILVRGVLGTASPPGVLRPRRPELGGARCAATAGGTDAIGMTGATDTAGMSAARASILVRGPSVRPRHLRVRFRLAPVEGDAPGGAAVDLVDQRMLGGMHVTDLVPTADGSSGGTGSPRALLPADASRLARDLLDPALDRRAVIARMRSSRRAVKTILLDQHVVSGVGNIYADEGLWAARVHGLRPGDRLGPRVVMRLLKETAAVMERALAVGGTSFDSLYVDADGAAGYFARELAAYGRGGLECRRCGEAMRTEAIGGRSHTFCPRCQVRPRR